MTKIKLTKTAVDAATFGAKEYELRDTVVPGFFLKVTPAGRKIFMVQYRTNAGERRKPAIGRFGELTVEQARSIAQDWLADVRKGKDPGAEKTAAGDAPSVKELCKKFIEDYSKPKNRTRSAPPALTAPCVFIHHIGRCNCARDWRWQSFVKRFLQIWLSILNVYAFDKSEAGRGAQESPHF